MNDLYSIQSLFIKVSIAGHRFHFITDNSSRASFKSFSYRVKQVDYTRIKWRVREDAAHDITAYRKFSKLKVIQRWDVYSSQANNLFSANLKACLDLVQLSRHLPNTSNVSFF